MQPLPWLAQEVYVSFAGGPAYTCQVTRCPGDVIRIGLDRLEVAAGTRADVHWTQDQRGSYACGTVVATPPGEPAGTYVRIDESVSGIERRHSVRLEVGVPALLSDRSGRLLQGRTLDLSFGGARVIVNLGGDADEAAVRERSGAPFTPGDRVIAEVVLPTGPVRSGCLVSGIGTEAGDVRLRFLDPDTSVLDRLQAFLHEMQQTPPDMQGDTF